MTRPPLSRQDYIAAGAEKKLRFTGRNTPSSVQEKTDWVCENPSCEKHHHKSYRAVKYGQYGCTCQNAVTLKADDYLGLASHLGIQWDGGPGAPRNSKTLTTWIGLNGNRVEATYHQLAYGQISEQLAHLLGLREEDDEPERATA